MPISTAAPETINPKKDMPIGILGSLAILHNCCTCCSPYVLSGVATVQEFRTNGAVSALAYAITKYMIGYAWLAKLVTVAILFGFTSVILVMLLGQSRVFYSMSRDGLVPSVFSRGASEVPHAIQEQHGLLFLLTSLLRRFHPR